MLHLFIGVLKLKCVNFGDIVFACFFFFLLAPSRHTRFIIFLVVLVVVGVAVGVVVVVEVVCVSVVAFAFAAVLFAVVGVVVGVVHVAITGLDAIGIEGCVFAVLLITVRHARLFILFIFVMLL